MPYTWHNADYTSLKYEHEGGSLIIPVDWSNSHYREFVMSGEIAADYVEPPAPPEPTPLTPKEKLMNLGLTEAELVTLFSDGHAAHQTFFDENGFYQVMTSREKVNYMCCSFNITLDELKAVLNEDTDNYEGQWDDTDFIDS